MSWCLLILLAVVTLPQETVVATSDGDSLQGQISLIDSSGIVLKSSGDDKRIAFNAIGDINFNRPVKSSAEEISYLKLVDSSKLLASKFSLKDRVASFETANQISGEIKVQNLQSVRLRNYAGKSELLTQWQKVSSKVPESGDAIVVNRDNQLETLEGIIADVDAEKVGFQMDDQTARINRTKIEGIVFYHAAGRKFVDPLAQATLTDGSRLSIRTLETSTENKTTCLVTTVAGVKLTMPFEVFSVIDFGSTRAIYLSALKPTSAEWKPLIASSAIMPQLRELKAPRFDRSFQNKALSLLIHPDKSTRTLIERREYRHGFAISGGSKIAFALSGKFTRLTGLVGFDPQANANGNAVFKIRCDGKIRFEQAIENDGSNPLEIDIDVSEIQRLVIEVGYHDSRAIGDVLHFCDAKVTK